MRPTSRGVAYTASAASAQACETAPLLPRAEATRFSEVPKNSSRVARVAIALVTLAAVGALSVGVASSGRGSIMGIAAFGGLGDGRVAIPSVSDASRPRDGALSDDASAESSSAALGIAWTNLPGVADPVLTTDAGVPAGQCDPNTCRFADVAAGHYEFVDNCLGGGSGCTSDSLVTGCRLCSVYEDAGKPPLYLPPCPPCICDAYQISDPNTLCARLLEAKRVRVRTQRREELRRLNHLKSSLKEDADDASFDANPSLDGNSVSGDASGVAGGSDAGEYVPLPATGTVPDAVQMSVAADGAPFDPSDGTGAAAGSEDEDASVETEVIVLAAEENDATASPSAEARAFDAAEARAADAATVVAAETYGKIGHLTSELEASAARAERVATTTDAIAARRDELARVETALLAPLGTNVTAKEELLKTWRSLINATREMEASRENDNEAALASGGVVDAKERMVALEDADAAVKALEEAFERSVSNASNARFSSEDVARLAAARHERKEAVDAMTAAAERAADMLRVALVATTATQDTAAAVAEAEAAKASSSLKIVGLERALDSASAKGDAAAFDAIAVKLEAAQQEIELGDATLRGDLRGAVEATASATTDPALAAATALNVTLAGADRAIASARSARESAAETRERMKALAQSLAQRYADGADDDSTRVDRDRLYALFNTTRELESDIADAITDALTLTRALDADKSLAAARLAFEKMSRFEREYISVAGDGDVKTLANMTVDGYAAVESVTDAALDAAFDALGPGLDNAGAALKTIAEARRAADDANDASVTLGESLRLAIEASDETEISTLELAYKNATTAHSERVAVLNALVGAEPSVDGIAADEDVGPVSDAAAAANGTAAVPNGTSVAVGNATDYSNSYVVPVVAKEFYDETVADEKPENELDGVPRLATELGAPEVLIEKAAAISNVTDPDEPSGLVAAIEKKAREDSSRAAAAAQLATPPAILNPNDNYRSYSSVYGNRVRGSECNRGTLDGGDAWCAGNKARGEWYQMDAGEVVQVVGVVTQRRKNSAQMVTKYKVSVSDAEDGNFTRVDDGYEFLGNSALTDTKVVRAFKKPVFARFVRIEVVEWSGGHPSMRAGLVTVPTPKPYFEFNPNDHYRSSSGSYDNHVKGHGCNAPMLDSSREAWCAPRRRIGDWIQMDLGRVETVAGVVTQARRGSDQMVTSYTVHVSDAANGPFDVVDDGFVFPGNVAIGEGKAERVFSHPVKARFVRIQVVTYANHPSMRAAVLLLPRGDADGDYDDDVVNPNDNYRFASSVYHSHRSGSGHNRGMLDSASAWLASGARGGEWYGLDAGAPSVVTGVVMQNRKDAMQHYVKKFKVMTSLTKDGGYEYVDHGYVFEGMSAQTNAKVFRRFATPVTNARFVKIEIVEYNGFPAMRAGLLIRPPADPVDEEELNPDDNARASSSSWTDAFMGKLYNQGMLDSPSAWCARHNRGGEWHRMDAGERREIVGVVTQSRADAAYQMVSSFTVQVADDAEGPWRVVDGGVTFTANVAMSSGRVWTRFAEPITARYVKIVVASYVDHVSMRSGLLVRPSTAPPRFVVRNPDDTHRTSSSVYAGDALGHGHNQGMLFSSAAWSASRARNGDWYQMEISTDGGLAPVAISGIAMQARRASDQMITAFTVEVSNSSTFEGEQTRVDDGAVFAGNTAYGEGVVHREFTNAYLAKHARITVVSYREYPSARIGFLEKVDEKASESLDAFDEEYTAVYDPNDNYRFVSSTWENDPPGYVHQRSALGSSQGWSAGHSVAGEWLTIDCGEVAFVAGIVTRPRKDHLSQMVTRYKVLVSDSRDGPYTYVDGEAEFVGNRAAVDHEVVRKFSAPVAARFVRVEVRAWLGFPSMRAGLLIIRDASEASDVVLNPNDNFRGASSTHHDNVPGSGHNRGMLDSPGGWSAKYAYTGDWYQIDLGEPTNVTGVVSQNRADAQWQMVSKYKVLVSSTSEAGPFAYVDGGAEFDGNTARGDGKVTRKFAQGATLAQYVRIEVTGFNVHPSGRFGVTALPRSNALSTSLATETLNPSDHARFASSVYGQDAKGTGHMRGMLDSPQAWTAAVTDQNQWYVIDAGEIRTVTGVVMQSRGDHARADQMVTRFTVSVADALDGPYVSVDDGFVFAGNRAYGDGKVTRVFAEPVTGRFVRVEPKSWSVWISMRVGLEVAKGGNSVLDVLDAQR